MDVFEAVRTKLTVREFKPDPVPDDVVDKLVTAARWTASSRNLQPWHFIVIRDRDTLAKLGDIASSGRFIANAPMAIAIAMESADRADLDAGRAMQQIELVAWGGRSRHLLRRSPDRRAKRPGQAATWSSGLVRDGYGPTFRVPSRRQRRKPGHQEPQAPVPDRPLRALWTALRLANSSASRRPGGGRNPELRSHTSARSAHDPCKHTHNHNRSRNWRSRLLRRWRPRRCCRHA